MRPSAGLPEGQAPKAKAPPVSGAFFFFYCISSVYQLQRNNLPNIFCGFGV
jgi:hypothetical protein